MGILDNIDLSTCHLMTSSINDTIPDATYGKLILSGVRCNECNKELTTDEILMHRYTGIDKAEDMSCATCWWKSAYDSINKL